MLRRIIGGCSKTARVFTDPLSGYANVWARRHKFSEPSQRGSRHPARAGLVYLARTHTLATNAELAAVLGLSRPESVPNLTRRHTSGQALGLVDSNTSSHSAHSVASPLPGMISLDLTSPARTPGTYILAFHFQIRHDAVEELRHFRHAYERDDDNDLPKLLQLPPEPRQQLRRPAILESIAADRLGPAIAGRQPFLGSGSLQPARQLNAAVRRRRHTRWSRQSTSTSSPPRPTSGHCSTSCSHRPMSECSSRTQNPTRN